MYQIEVDFDVYKGLTALRETEDVTYNDVIRELLGLSTKKPATAAVLPGAPPAGGLTCKGVHFPEGMDWRAKYKGVIYDAKIVNGKILVKGKYASTPSQAANIVTGTVVNGWEFWTCRVPGSKEAKMLKVLKD